MKRNSKITMLIILFAVIFILTACNRDEIVPIEFTIVFNTNGGSDIDNIVINSETTTFNMPDDPTKDDYIFGGWFFDNDTFDEEVTVAGIIGKLSETVTTVTVYAKWDEEPVDFGEAMDVLEASFISAYETVSLKSVEVPTTEDVDRLAVLLDTLTTVFSLDVEDTKYNKIYQIYYGINEYETYLDCLAIISIITEEDDIYTLTPTQQDEVNDISSKYGYNDDFFQAFYYAQYILATYGLDPISSDDYELALEYVDLFFIVDSYDIYLENLENFTENLQELLQLFNDDDIRADKILAFALFIADYDYDLFLEEIEEGYYQPSSTGLLDFIFNAVDASGLTSDDIGIISFNFLNFAFTKNILSSEEQVAYFAGEIAELEADIALLLIDIAALDPVDDEFEILTKQWDIENKEETIEDYEKRMADNADFKVMMEVIQEELTMLMVTDMSTLFFNTFRILNNNNVFALIENTNNSDQGAPSLDDIAIVLSSIQSACEDFTDTYNSSVFNNATAVLLNLIDAVKDEIDNEQVLYLDILSAAMSAFGNIYDQIVIAKDVLAIFDLETLEIFFEEEIEDGKRDINLIKNQYLFDNIAILEAKLTVAILGDDYTAEEEVDQLNNLYDMLIPILNSLIAMYGQDNPMIIEAVPFVRNIAQVLLEKVLIIGDDDYLIIKDIAELDYITDDVSPLTNDMRYALLVSGTYAKAMYFNDMIIEIIEYFVPDMDMEDVSVMPASIVLAILDIDMDKFEAFKDSVLVIEEEIGSPAFFISVISALLNAELVDENIIDLLTLVLDNGVNYLVELYNFFELNYDEINSILVSVLQDSIDELDNYILDLEYEISILVDEIDYLLGIIADLDPIEDEYYISNLEFMILMNEQDITDYQITIEELEESKSKLETMKDEYFTILLDMAIEIIDYYSVEMFIDIITSILDEAQLAIDYIGFDGEMPNMEFMLFAIKTVVIILGEAPETDLNAVILATGEDNLIIEVINALLDVYDTVLILYDVDYANVADYGTEIQDVIMAIMGRFLH